MTDEEKIAWFDKMVKWVDDLGGAEEVIEMTEYCTDMPYDLLFQFLDQYNKTKK